jgi:hypothetical protein
MKGGIMRVGKAHLIGTAAVLLTVFLFGCDSKKDSAAEITPDELTASVQELYDLHEAVYPLWHDAYPAKDYALIESLLPQLDSLTARLDAAELPGILMDKEEAWNKEKSGLKQTLADLHIAVKEGDKQGMLENTEQFHAYFERLVRTIRPMVKELDAFHQELYKLYHYYMPNDEQENIYRSALAMQSKMPPLKEVELRGRFSARQERFQTAVAELDTAVNQLAELVKKKNKAAVREAVEKVHSAYRQAEAVFN